MSLLNIVDESGKIKGNASRKEIHEKGLLHREIHIWMYTPKNEIIFQHRAKDKDTFPDKLDATVGGHVEIGQTWEQAALMELKEEAGVKAKISDLLLIEDQHTNTYDPVTKSKNNALRRVYALKYGNDIRDLQIEDGKSQGFEAWSISKLKNLTPVEKQRFIPKFYSPRWLKMFENITKEEF